MNCDLRVFKAIPKIVLCVGKSEKVLLLVVDHREQRSTVSKAIPKIVLCVGKSDKY